MIRVLSVVMFEALFISVGEAQNQSPTQSAIPGVTAQSARVELVRDDFKGLEGPVDSAARRRPSFAYRVATLSEGPAGRSK